MNKAQVTERSVIENGVQNTHFYEDVIRGLSSMPKYLDSKYFYNAKGDELFQQIMHTPEYYLTNCEFEILTEKADQLINTFSEQIRNYDLLELGPGDATKSAFLLKSLLEDGIDFTYFPVDISANVISMLAEHLPKRLPGLSVSGLNGDYFDMLEMANQLSSKNKIVLFLGSNIGNMTPAQAEDFLKKLNKNLTPGDLLLIGFDLKKSPSIILDAYNDHQGFTREFNLNLLNRINQELDADFDTKKFKHFPSYDPETGACKSYLISKVNHSVRIGPSKHRIDFIEHESILMEISQKYTLDQIHELALKTGFTPITNFVDSNKWFVDAVWKL